MIETFRGVAHPWLCDDMGHLNIRHYVGLFDDASMHFLSAMGANAATIVRDGLGWADVRLELDLKAEVPQGALVVIRSGVVRIGRSSITYRQEMRDATGEVLHAVQTTVTVAFDIVRRKSAPLDDALRGRLSRYPAPEYQA